MGVNEATPDLRAETNLDNPIKCKWTNGRCEHHKMHVYTPMALDEGENENG